MGHPAAGVAWLVNKLAAFSDYDTGFFGKDSNLGSQWGPGNIHTAIAGAF